MENETWNAAIEAAAKVCDEHEALWWQQYKGIAKPGERDHLYSQHREGMSDGAGKCAKRIRALKKTVKPEVYTAIARSL
jgi:hypothetical protein